MTHPNLTETREMQRRLSVLADRVTAEGADYPEAIITRVIDDELLAESLLSSADPDWTKAQDRQAEAWREMLEDGRDARDDRTDWAWPA